MKSLSDFHDVTFNFLRPKVTDTGTVLTLGNFSISSRKEISLNLETIEGRIYKRFSISSLQTATKTKCIWFKHILFFINCNIHTHIYIKYTINLGIRKKDGRL